MANFNHRISENVPGPFYVDDSCVDCDMCRSHAPQFFARSGSRGSSYVVRQPVTPEEVAEAEAALIGCPTDSIGNDASLVEDCRTNHPDRLPTR